MMTDLQANTYSEKRPIKLSPKSSHFARENRKIKQHKSNKKQSPPPQIIINEVRNSNKGFWTPLISNWGYRTPLIPTGESDGNNPNFESIYFPCTATKSNLVAGWRRIARSICGGSLTEKSTFFFIYDNKSAFFLFVNDTFPPHAHHSDTNSLSSTSHIEPKKRTHQRKTTQQQPPLEGPTGLGNSAARVTARVPGVRRC